MTDFDPHDDELAAALRRRAGSPTRSPAVAHAAVLARSSTIRRRRAAIGGGLGMATLLIGGALLLPRGGDRLAPADGDPLPSVDVDESITDDLGTGPARDDRLTDVTTGEPSPGEASPATTLQVVGGGSTPTSASPPTVPDDAVTMPSVGGGDEAPVTTRPRTTVPTTTPSTTPPTVATTTAPAPGIAPFTKQYSSAGGSITVRWDGASLGLVSVDPAPGHVADVRRVEPLRIEVRFEGPTDARIEIRVEDGELSVSISP